MMLEGSFTEDLSHMENRKPAAPHIFRSILFHKKRWFNDVVTNWHSTDN